MSFSSESPTSVLGRPILTDASLLRPGDWMVDSYAVDDYVTLTERAKPVYPPGGHPRLITKIEGSWFRGASIFHYEGDDIPDQICVTNLSKFRVSPVQWVRRITGRPFTFRRKVDLWIAPVWAIPGS